MVSDPEQYLDVNTILLKASTLSLSCPYFYKSSVTEHKFNRHLICNNSEWSVNKEVLPFYYTKSLQYLQLNI